MTAEQNPSRRDLWRLSLGIGVAATGYPLIREGISDVSSSNQAQEGGLAAIGNNDQVARRDVISAQNGFNKGVVFLSTGIADEVAALAVIAAWAVRRWGNTPPPKASKDIH